MKLYVIMGNDYPDAVFDDEEAAKRLCNKKNAENRVASTKGMIRRVYWRSYEFELNKET